jgi:site-specific DNA recombinase
VKAALYLRVSTDAQTERFSLPAQRRILAEFCERQGWQYEVYEDAGISGETISARPAMQRLLRDAQAKAFGVALAVEVERFSRSTDLFDWLAIRKTFRDAGIRWGTPSQLFAPDDPEDGFLTVLFGALAAREKQKLVQRTRRGKEQAVRQGRYIASWRPYGYTVADGRLQVKDDEARTIRYIFALNRDGRTIREIVRTLNRERIPTPRQAFGHTLAGTQWQRSTVRHILANPLYAGCAYYGKTRQVGGRRERQPEDTWLAIPAPRIISDEEFSLAQRRIQHNAAVAKRNQRNVYVLKGLVFCQCGRLMYGNPCGGRRYYRPNCQDARHVRADELEALVWREVVRALRQPALVLAEAKRQREARFGEQDEATLRLGTVRAALARLPAERERVLLQHQEGYLDWPAAKARLDSIRRRQADLEDERDRLEARLWSAAAHREQDASLRALLERFGKRLAALAPEERMLVIRGFLRRVTVAPDGGVTLDGYLPPAPTNSRTRGKGQ